MYALVSDYEYPESFCFVSNNPGELEEMALSIFEEDWYEWFCIIMDNEKDIPEDEIKQEAFFRTLESSFDDYEIREAVFLN